MIDNTGTPIHESIRNYPAEAMRLAFMRGFDVTSHNQAVISGDIDAMGLTHPFMYLTEQEQIDLWEPYYET